MSKSDRYQVWEEVDEHTFKIRLDGEDPPLDPPLFHKRVGPLHRTHDAAQRWLMSNYEETEEQCLRL